MYESKKAAGGMKKTLEGRVNQAKDKKPKM